MNQVLDKSLLGGVLCSLAVHAAVGLAIAWAGDRSLAKRADRQPEPVLVSLLPPPKPPAPPDPPKPPEPTEPPLLRLGIEESVADTMAWLGFSEETEHVAPPLGMDQSAMELEPGDPGPPQPATVNSKPSDAAREAQPAPPVEPTPRVEPVPPVKPAPPVADEPATDPVQPAAPAPPPAVRPPGPSEAIPVPSPQSPPSPPRPAPAPAPSEATTKPAEPGVKPADAASPPVQAKPDIKPAPEPPRVEEQPKPIESKQIESKPIEPQPIEPKPEPVVEPPAVQPAEIERPPQPLPVPLPLPPPWNAVVPPPGKAESGAVPPAATSVEPSKEPDPTEDLDPAAEAARAMEEATVVPEGGPATPAAANEQNPANPAAPAKPASAASSASPPQSASVAAQAGGGGRPGERADREADPSSAKPVHVDKWKLGKVLAAKGVEIRTTRPYWSTTTLLTTSPKSPTVRVKFSRTGKVTSAEFVDDRGSGYESVDGPLIDAIYRWTASGKPLRELPATDPNARLTIVFVISLR